MDTWQIILIELSRLNLGKGYFRQGRKGGGLKAMVMYCSLGCDPPVVECILGDSIVDCSDLIEFQTSLLFSCTSSVVSWRKRTDGWVAKSDCILHRISSSPILSVSVR